MGLLKRFRLWRLERKTLRLTLGAVPLPTLIPDAEEGLKEIYSIQTKKGYKLVRFWEVLIIGADRDHYSVQFFPIAPDPNEALAIAVKGSHIIKYMPVVSDMVKLDRIQKGLAAKKTFELTLDTELGMMSRHALESIGVLDKDKAPVE